MDKNFNFTYQEFNHYSELPQEWITLIEAAKDVTHKSYAPYSNFHVGSSILDSNDKIHAGANQENASYSLTICAERTALGNYSINAANEATYIKAMAVTYFAENVALSSILAPCGACRQHILEYQSRQDFQFPIIFTAINGSTIVVDSIAQLLPFTFSKSALPQNNN